LSLSTSFVSSAFRLIDLGVKITSLEYRAGQTDRYCSILEGAKYNTIMVSVDMDE
jgi:hypothetical protein